MSDRIDLPDGAWATFRTTYGWGPHIRGSFIDGDGSEAFVGALGARPSSGAAFPTDAGGWLDWSVTAEKPTLTDADMDNIAGHVGDAVLGRCRSNWNAWVKGRPTQKAPAHRQPLRRRTAREGHGPGAADGPVPARAPRLVA